MSRVRALAGVIAVALMAGCTTGDEAPITERSTTAPTTAPSSAPGGDVGPLGFSRPWVDPTICRPTGAWEGDATGIDLRMFSQASQHPFTIQALATPDLGPAGPFAVVLRYVDQPTSMDNRQTTTINGVATAVTAATDGDGEAIWALPDGGLGYLRSRGGLDAAAITAIVAALTPRPSDAAVPGFDFDPDGAEAANLVLVTEHVNRGLSERGAGITCQPPGTEHTYLVVALTGDPVLLFARVIDRLTPLDVALVGDTLVIVSGPPASPLFTAGQLTEADPAEWQALLDATPASGSIVEVQP